MRVSTDGWSRLVSEKRKFGIKGPVSYSIHYFNRPSWSPTFATSFFAPLLESVCSNKLLKINPLWCHNWHQFRDTSARLVATFAALKESSLSPSSWTKCLCAFWRVQLENIRLLLLIVTASQLAFLSFRCQRSWAHEAGWRHLAPLQDLSQETLGFLINVDDIWGLKIDMEKSPSFVFSAIVTKKKKKPYLRTCTCRVQDS